MRYYIIFSALLISVAPSCKKITDVSPDSSVKAFKTLGEAQALLDDDRVMNGYGDGGYPSMTIICGDEYFSTDAQFDKYSLVNKQAMTWASQIQMGPSLPDWDFSYRTVGTVNNVFTRLADIGRTAHSAKWDTINTRGRFYRAYAVYQIAQLFCPAYDSSSAATDLGIPLPQTADQDQKVARSSVQHTYDQIIGDLRIAEGIPSKDNDWRPTRPSLAAVYAMFARVYLSARNYKLALSYADSCLQQQSALMLYDTIKTTRRFPFSRWNPEVIFCSAYYRSSPARIGTSYVDTNLLHSYEDNDLRKILFFKSDGTFRGTYDEDGMCFGGIATDEIWLIHSECLAREGDIAGAMKDLNHLLETRWAAGTFIPYAATKYDEALQLILLERRKELLLRGTRWTDLRRLNKDTPTAQTITRTVKGITYTLPYNSVRWTLPIPDYVLYRNPGMPDNVR